MLCTYGQEKHPNLRYEGPSSTMRALAHVGQKTNMATKTRLLSTDHINDYTLHSSTQVPASRTNHG